MNFDYIIYSVLSTILFIYCGIGLTLLLCPKNFFKYTIFLSPFVGLSYLAACTWWSIHFIPGGVSAFVFPLLAIPALFIFAAAWIKKDEIKPFIRFPGKETIWLLILCFILFIFISFPLIFMLNNGNVLVIGNNDITNYATISKFLVSSSLINPVPGVDTHILYLIENNNFGAFIATAVPSAVFSIQTYIIQNSIQNLFFIFSLPVIYLVTIEIFNFRPTIAMVGVFLIGLNYNLLYILHTGFVGQVLGYGMFLALLSLTLYPILNCKSFREFRDYIPLASIFMFGMIAAYSPFILLYFIPVIGFLVLAGIINQNTRKSILSISFLTITTIIGVFIALPLAINRYKEISYFSQSIPAGWPVPIMSPDQIFGFVGNEIGWLPIQNAFSESFTMPLTIRFALSILIIIILYLSFKRLFQTNRELFCYAMIFFTVIVAGYCYYSMLEIASPSFTGEGYKAYKLLTFGLPMIIIFLLVYLKDINLNPFKPGNKKWYCSLILILIIAGNIWSGTAMIDMVSQKSYPIKENIIDLQKINDMENVTSINVEESGYSDQMWIYYFLFMNKTLHLKYTTYFRESPLTGDWDLRSNYNSILNLENFDEKIVLNDDYYLIKNESSMRVDFKEGWYRPEYNAGTAFRWTGHNNESPTLEIILTQSSILDIELKYYSIIENNSFTVELNNETITECTDDDFCKLKTPALIPGQHTLRFKPKYPPISPGPADPRTLGYAFININLTSNTLIPGV